MSSVSELVPAYLRQEQHLAYMTRLLTPDMHPPYHAAHYSSNGNTGMVEVSGVGSTSVQKLSDGETVYVPLRERLLNKAHTSTPVVEETEAVDLHQEQTLEPEESNQQQVREVQENMHKEEEEEEVVEVMYDYGYYGHDGVDMSEDADINTEANSSSASAAATEPMSQNEDVKGKAEPSANRVSELPSPLPKQESEPQEPPLPHAEQVNSKPIQPSTIAATVSAPATVSEPLPSSSSSSQPAEPRSQKRKRASTAAFCSLLAIGSPKAMTPVATAIPAPTPTSTSHNSNPPIAKRTATPKVTRIEPAEDEDDDGALQHTVYKRPKKESSTSSSGSTRRKPSTPSRTRKGFSIVESDSSSTSTAGGDEEEGEGDERPGATAAGHHTKHSHQSQQHKGQSQQSMFSPQRRADLRKSAVKSYSNSYYDDD